MCSIKQPKPQKIEVPDPQYLRNPLLDDDARQAGASASSQRTGRSSLRIPLDKGLAIGFGGRGGSSQAPNTGGPRGNGRKPGWSKPLPSITPVKGGTTNRNPGRRGGSRGGGKGGGNSLVNKL